MTAKQWVVLKTLATGMSRAEAAAKLGCSVSSVNSHCCIILDELGARSILHACRITGVLVAPESHQIAIK